jgi:hypothetical protein
MFRHDLRMQWRYRLPAAGVVVAAVWLTALAAVPSAALPAAMPIAIFTDVAVFGYLFVAGLAFFERDERVLNALVVSPLTAAGYVISKVAALTVLAVAVSVALVLGRLGPGAAVDWPCTA